MNKPNPQPVPVKLSPKIVLVGIVLLVVYLLLKPWLEQQLGMQLPGFGEQQPAQVTQGTSPPKLPVPDEPIDPDLFFEETEKEEQPHVVQTQPEPNPTTQSVENKTQQSSVEQAPQLGELKQVSRTVYESTAGLRYTSGSQDGHRLTHLMKHAGDDPDRPVHGVFDGTKRGILVLLDEAWTIAQKRGPPQVQKDIERDRTIYTIDMKKRIGYVGGQRGDRDNHPACRKIRLVVEGRDVITAYPVK